MYRYSIKRNKTDNRIATFQLYCLIKINIIKKGKIMLNSKDRIDFIKKYISAYKEQIELSNSHGLYDSAKLFENFARELCMLWFNQDFINLNDEVSNFAYVDLMSSDNSMYVQVSTVKDVPTKIKNTLDKIKVSEKPQFKSIKKIVFFVLGNRSVENVVDYTGENQIGNIPFTKKDNLITTDDILQKATDDLDFQCKLYDILKREVESVDSVFSQLVSALHLSKTAINNIDSYINEEYYIDRSKFISKIKQCEKRFVCVQGGPGTGKTVVCKKLVEDEENVLFVRAEQIAQATTLFDIWGLDIEKIAKYWANKKLIIFIDALEFIADALKAKLDILFHLYEIIQQNQYIYIISSCRTSDKNAFLKLDSAYNITSFELDYLSKDEINDIAKKYIIISEMMNNVSYSALLSSPFYVNLIISKIKSINDNNDETYIRNLIWQNVICLKDKAIEYKLDSKDVLKAINSIVFERAQNFTLGVPKENFSQEIVKALLSEGVVIEHGNMLRLKYDIFEDICFEHHFDNEFLICKGNYNNFFNKIETLGRCIYRRYQIWVSNKIFTKDNRDKFLYNLVFSKKMPTKWREQTIIGIIKSKYCEPFFEEYSVELLSRNTITDFINITNLYGFEAKSIITEKDSFLMLSPVGYGREALIDIVYKNELYKKTDVNSASIVKLCTDYSNSKKYRDDSVKNASFILEYFIDAFLSKIDKEKYYKADEYLWGLVVPVYQMSRYTKEWIKSFWDRLKENVQKAENDNYLFSRVLIEKTITSAPVPLYIHMTKDICLLAEFFWTYDDSKVVKRIGHYGFDDNYPYKYYGLNENANRISHDTHGLSENRFFKWIFNCGEFYTALDWVIEFVNKCVLRFAETLPDCVMNTEICFIDNDTTKSYYGTREMWMAIEDEYQIPMVISDLAYSLKEFLCDIVEHDYTKDKKTNEVLQGIRDIIYEKSNNVILLAVIASVAMQFPTKLPGLMLDLASCIDIVLWDISRHSKIMQKSNPIMQGLLNSIYLSIGMPKMKMRYEHGYSHKNLFKQYVMCIQLQCDETLVNKCHKILDWLYKKYPNDTDNAIKCLQVQHMDIRKAKVEQVDDKTCAIVPTDDGEAKKIRETVSPENKALDRINELASEFMSKGNNNELEINYVISTIGEIKKIIDTVDCASAYSRVLMLFISQAMTMPNLPVKNREDFCQLWIDGIKSIMRYEAFVFDYDFSVVLFSQLEQKISKAVKDKIKELMLDCIMYQGSQGIIDNKIVPIINSFLSERKRLSSAFVNTVIKLAEDEMEHQKYNAKCAKEYYNWDDEEYVPNMTPKLNGVDAWLEESEQPAFVSKREEIIQKFLFDEESVDLQEFNIDSHDLETLMYISNCGLDAKEETNNSIIKIITQKLIDYWKTSENRLSNIVNINVYLDFISMLKKSISKNLEDISFVLKILFDNVDFEDLPYEAYEFYHSIFSEFLIIFFDSHSNAQLRANCKKAILTLEQAINQINCERSKIVLYKAVILSVTDSIVYADWSECGSGYSYRDKQFLNEQFTKYGKYHFEDMIRTIYKMHYRKLMPEILISLSEVLKDMREIDKNCDNVIIKNKDYISIFITNAFLNHSDSIKNDEALTKAFESVLEYLISLNFENAAVILDEFRIH